MATHTPGPWQTVDMKNVTAAAHHGFTVASVDTFTGNSVCPKEERDANAALIAAAPELLESCRAFLRAPSIGSSGPGSVTIEVQTFHLDAARAAIAKATGSVVPA